MNSRALAATWFLWSPLPSRLSLSAASGSAVLGRRRAVCLSTFGAESSTRTATMARTGRVCAAVSSQGGTWGDTVSQGLAGLRGQRLGGSRVGDGRWVQGQ